MDSSNINYDGHDLETLSGLDNYYNWIIELFGRHIHGTTIEYGAGSGTNSARILPLVESLELVEPSQKHFKALISKFNGSPAVKVVNSTLEQHISIAANDYYDCAILINVLEHINEDARAVRELSRALRPGGKLLIFVPALPSLFSPMDKVLGHYRRYRRTDLCGLVTSNGFEIVDARYMDLLGILTWWFVNTVCGAIKFNPTLVHMYDRVGVPLTRTIESLFSSVPFGKNIALIARKPIGY